jgi:hypothetical protein
MGPWDMLRRREQLALGSPVRIEEVVDRMDCSVKGEEADDEH